MTTKVAIVTNILTPYRIPLFNQLNKYEEFDFTIYLLAENENNRLWSINNDVEFECKLLPDYGIDLSNHIKIIYHLNPHIISEIQKQNFDAVICAGYDSFTALLVFLMCKLKKIPLLFWSGSTAYENNNILRFIGRPIIKLFTNYSDGFIAYGSRAKQFLVSNGAAENKIFKAYNTVDTDYYYNECQKYKAQRQKILTENNFKTKKYILYVGQLIERKGIKTLIDAFTLINKNDNISLLIVGEGKDKTTYMEYCSNNKIKNIYFIGHKNSDILPLYYSIADVFVLPSLSEVWGLVINEALACGIPVITTNNVGASEDLIVDGENGYVIEANNAEKLSETLESIIFDDSSLKILGENSRKYIGNFSIESSAKGFINALKCTLKLSNDEYE